MRSSKKDNSKSLRVFKSYNVYNMHARLFVWFCTTLYIRTSYYQKEDRLNDNRCLCAGMKSSI